MARLEIPREAAAKAGFWTKKGLGQHLLRDPSVAEASVKALGVRKGDGILEIGPGLGALTEALLATGAKVLAVELDASACEALRQRFADQPRLDLVQADVLEADLGGLARASFGSGPFHIAANLPYYITTPVLAKVLESRLPFTRMAVLTQWEVGRRLAAAPGGKEYAAISVLAQYHCRVEVLRRVLPGAFTPPPKVDSALLLFERRPKPAVAVKDEALFFKAVRSAFGKRRKTLRNSLSMPGGLQAPLAAVDAALKSAKIDPARRAETMSIKEFGRLADALAAALRPG